MREIVPQGIRSITEKESRKRQWGPIKLESRPRLRCKRIFNSQGRILQEFSEDQQVLFCYEKDLLINRYTLNQEEQPLERIDFLYDDENRCIMKKIHLEGAEEPRIIEITYQQQGLLMVEKEGETLRAVQRNRQGQIIKELLYTGKDPDSITSYKYGDKIEEISTKDAAGKLRTKEIRRFNDAGILIEQRWEDGAGEILRQLNFSYPAGEDQAWLLCRVSTPHPLFPGKEKELYRIHRELNYYPGGEIPGTMKAEKVTPDLSEKIKAFPNGIYTGPLKDEKMSGQGEFRFNDGGIYRGEFRENRMHGKGSLEFADGRVYKGDFRENRMEGQGQCHWPNGDNYRGSFVNGKMHGVGEFTWANGDRFKGGFEHNHRSAQGVIIPAKDS